MKVQRTAEDLKETLKDNLELLNESLIKIKQGDFKYVKVVLASLRVLVVEGKSNKALLFRIAEKHGITPVVHIDSPFGEKNISLKDHMNDLYFASNTENIRLTNLDFISKHSQQEGLAHEDWELDNEIVFPNRGILIGGLPPKIRKATILGDHVYRAGVELLIKI